MFIGGRGWSLIVGKGGGGGMQKRESPDFRYPEVGMTLCMTYPK